MAITKPTVGSTGWNTAVDATIDGVNHYQAPTVALTDGATISVNAANGRNYKVTVGASGRSVAKPTNGYDGQVITITVEQDGTGSRTWSLGTGYRLATGVAVTPSTTAGVSDKVVAQYDATADVWDVVAFFRADGGSGGASNPWEFRPEDFGAVGDNSTNDQAAINAAVSAATDYALAHNYYAEVVFSPKTYVVSGATIKGGAGQGNAQIPLPAVATTGRKLTLVLRGCKGSDTFGHWEQTVPQDGNATVRTTLTGLSIDVTWGAPSVFGCPTAGTYAAGNAFTNLRIVVDGVNVVAPANPGIIAFDFMKAAQMKIINAGAFGNAGPAGTPALTTIPTNDLGIGLRTSKSLNNAVCDVDTFAVEGFYAGAVIGEHFTALRFLAVYCHVGIYIPCSGGDYHGGSITYACIEQAVDAIQAVGGSSGTFPLTIGLLDTEQVSGYTINDPLDALTSTALWMCSDASPVAPTVNSAANYKLLSARRQHVPGAKTAPSVPSSTVAHTNTFWRDCAVSVSGGTVTVIAVDGQTTGLTAGTVIVPSGKSITLTYSAAPSWAWVAL